MKTIIHDFDSAVFEELFPETAQLTRLGTSEPPAVNPFPHVSGTPLHWLFWLLDQDSGQLRPSRFLSGDGQTAVQDQ